MHTNNMIKKNQCYIVPQVSRQTHTRLIGERESPDSEIIIIAVRQLFTYLESGISVQG